MEAASTIYKYSIIQFLGGCSSWYKPYHAPKGGKRIGLLEELRTIMNIMNPKHLQDIQELHGLWLLKLFLETQKEAGIRPPTGTGPEANMFWLVKRSAFDPCVETGGVKKDPDRAGHGKKPRETSELYFSNLLSSSWAWGAQVNHGKVPSAAS